MINLDQKIQENIQKLLTQLRGLEMIERKGAPSIHPSRAVRNAIYSLQDLLRDVDDTP